MTDDGAGPAAGRRADAERNRAAIIDAALAVLAEDAMAPMEAVAAEAGLSRVTLYRHFGSREALISAIREEAMAEAAHNINATNLDGCSAADALRRAARTLLPLGLRFRIVIQEGGEHAAEVLHQRTAIFRPVRQAIRRGQADGEIRGDLPADWILDAFAALLMLAVRRGAEEPALDPIEAADRVCETLLSGIST